MDQLTIIAIRKGERFYLCRYDARKQYNYTPNSVTDWSRLRINGEPVSASFSEDWFPLDSDPREAAWTRVVPPVSRVSGYKLRDGFPASEKMPASVPPTFFSCECEDEPCESDVVRALYDPVVETSPETIEPVEVQIEMLDEDCEPRIPKYPFVSEFPYFVNFPVVSWYKYPCSISGDSLYDVIRRHIKDHLPDHCRITSDYDFHFAVARVLPLRHEESMTIFRNGRRGKITEEQRPRLERIVPAFAIQKQKEKYSDAERLPTIHAENYDELEKQIDALVKEYDSILGDPEYVCPSCKGTGVLPVVRPAI